MEPLAWYRLIIPLAACMGLAVLAVVRPIPRLRFAAMGLGYLVGYAILQDQVSARLCPEYFTVFHPPIRGLTDPTLLGIAWGFLGAWWGGVTMGYAAGLTATLGPWPRLAPRDLVRPMLVVIVLVGIATGLTGLTVDRHADMLDVSISPGAAADIPLERQRGLLVVSCYHFVAYASAVIASVGLCVWVTWERKRRSHRRES